MSLWKKINFQKEKKRTLTFWNIKMCIQNEEIVAGEVHKYPFP